MSEPDLGRAALHGAALGEASVREADLARAHLGNANLSEGVAAYSTEMIGSVTMFKNVALSFLSIVATLIVCEIALRLFVPVRTVGPSFSKYDPIYGTSPKKNMRGLRITPEYRTEMSTNSYGWRGTEPKHFPSHSVLFLGDSFTMGIGVNDGEEFPALIAKEFSQVERLREIPIVNMGINDNGNGRWVKFLKREGYKYNPRLIVIQFHGNDFYDNIRERFFFLAEMDN